MNIKYYWNNKEDRKKIANNHNIEMNKKYYKEIKYSILNTIIYNDNNIKKDIIKGIPKIKLVDIDSVNAILKYKNNKTAILNFASFKNPGGGFLNGSRAQEECLCHASFLYNVLSNFIDYYNYNRQHINNSLYLNRALYSPSILFKDKILCDVITCASPNISFAKKTNNKKVLMQNKKVLKDRIKFILDIANTEKVNTLILGAFGCGAFGQDPNLVANYFKELIKTNNYGNINTIIFAIPKQIDLNNYNIFKFILGNEV